MFRHPKKQKKKKKRAPRRARTEILLKIVSSEKRLLPPGRPFGKPLIKNSIAPVPDEITNSTGRKVLPFPRAFFSHLPITGEKKKVPKKDLGSGKEDRRSLRSAKMLLPLPGPICGTKDETAPGGETFLYLDAALGGRCFAEAECLRSSERPFRGHSRKIKKKKKEKGQSRSYA